MIVNILGIPYTVEEVDRIDPDVRMFGQIDYPNQRILLEKGMAPEYAKQTLMHEILHGILEGLGYDDINSDDQKVQSIATALYQVFGSQVLNELR